MSASVCGHRGHVHTPLREKPEMIKVGKIIPPTKQQKFDPTRKDMSQGCVDMSTRPHTNRSVIAGAS